MAGAECWHKSVGFTAQKTKNGLTSQQQIYVLCTSKSHDPSKYP